MSFQFSVLLLQLRRKRNFVANANNFWVSSCSVKILDHTTECILLETNSQKKNSGECTQEPGLAANWRQLGGTGQVDTWPRSASRHQHCGQMRQNRASNCLTTLALKSAFICVCCLAKDQEMCCVLRVMTV